MEPERRLFQDRVGHNLVSTVFFEGRYETVAFPSAGGGAWLWEEPRYMLFAASEKDAIRNHRRIVRKVYEGTRGALRKNREIIQIHP